MPIYCSKSLTPKKLWIVIVKGGKLVSIYIGFFPYLLAGAYNQDVFCNIWPAQRASYAKIVYYFTHLPKPLNIMNSCNQQWRFQFTHKLQISIR